MEGVILNPGTGGDAQVGSAFVSIGESANCPKTLQDKFKLIEIQAARITGTILRIRRTVLSPPEKSGRQVG